MADRTVKVLENGRFVPRGLSMRTSGLVLLLDEDETLDVTFNWSSWLGDDTIASITNEADGVTVGSESNTTTTATFTVTNSPGAVQHRITTVGGLIKEARVYVNSPAGGISDDYGFYRPSWVA